MRETRRLRCAAWCAFALTAAGCAGVVSPTTRAAVDSSLSALDAPQSRRAIEDLLRSDEVDRATRSLTRAVLGELQSGGGPGTDARLTRLANDFARDIAPALGTTLDDVVLPRVQAAIAAAVKASLDQALGDPNRQRVARFTADVARQAVAGVAPQLEASIVRAVGRILRQDLAPAIGQVLADDTPALAHATRALTAAALDGVNDAMAGPFGDMFRKERQATIAQVQAAEAQQQRALVDEIEKQVAQSRRWFVGLVAVSAVLGVALLAIGVVLWRLLAAHRELLRRQPA